MVSLSSFRNFITIDQCLFDISFILPGWTWANNIGNLSFPQNNALTSQLTALCSDAKTTSFQFCVFRLFVFYCYYYILVYLSLCLSNLRFLGNILKRYIINYFFWHRLPREGIIITILKLLKIVFLGVK